jgi:Domain of unknown function (DUF4440)
MKRCPTCNRTFTDPTLSFCTDDGTPLVPVVAAGRASASDQTIAAGETGKDEGHEASNWNPAAYQPPRSYIPPGGESRRRVWPWVLGIGGFFLVALVGLSIAAVMLLPRLTQGSGNNNQRAETTPTTNRAPAENTNANSNSDSTNKGIVPAETNSNKNEAANVNSEIPVDKDLVLTQLTDLEHEWTVANLNADKKSLARILADDYAGPAADGAIQGKADYIKNIKRDTSVEKWDFQGLKLTLRGDRATLTGRLRLVIQGQESVYSFVDKFVWRDGRWQATGSEVTPVQAE